MNEAQLGLLIVTPAVVAMAVLLCRQGALSKSGATIAALAAIAAASWMFFTQ